MGAIVTQKYSGRRIDANIGYVFAPKLRVQTLAKSPRAKGRFCVFLKQW